MTGTADGGLAWAEMMRLGLGALRLPPEAFWNMTPVEFRRALEGAGLLPVDDGRRRLDRATLERLMARFPDEAGGRTG